MCANTRMAGLENKNVYRILRTIFANILGPNERVICEHFVVLIKYLWLK